MKQEATIVELLAIRKQAEQASHNIDRLWADLCAERQALRQAVGDYSEKRVELFKAELQARGLTWCTICAKEVWQLQETIPEENAVFILLEGRAKYSCGYENSCYGFRDFFEFHRACPGCREKAFDEHGTHGHYDTQAKDQSSFYAFRVEKREDGYYARKFGNWIKLDDGKCKIPEPPGQLVERLVEEWDLPPRVEIKFEWPGSEGKLVIHERVAMAKAV